MKNKYMSFPYGDYEGEYLEYGKPHGKGTFNYFDGVDGVLGFTTIY